ncbi:MAG: ribonuclease Z [Nitrosopumilus sp. B06]|nr:MAG: ribonuclease Z [Nitrosopumilus sp. B06]
MKLVFLGTSAAQPTARRALSCTCLERNGEIFVFDAGEAAQVSYMKAGLGWNKKMRIFITHMHGDHCVGLFGLLQTMSMRKRTEPLEIFGPAGIDEFVAANTRMLNFGLSFPVMISVVSEGRIYEDGEVVIDACRANHKVTAFSYRIVEKDRPGRFDVKKAGALDIPKVLWSRLQNGEEVVVNGKKTSPGEVLGERRPGKKIGISGDTAPTESLKEFFAGCDILVFDATFLDSEESKAQETLHSTARQAAMLAKKAGVKSLVLTHFSSRYKDESGHLREAREVFDSVTAARDLLEMEIR